MNFHLNYFRPYSINQEHEHLENNLSRALALCLKSSSVFSFEFISKIFRDTDQYHLLEAHLINSNKDSNLSVDIQRNMNSIEGISTLFAVSLSGGELDLSDFSELKSTTEGDQTTDVFIQLNDIGIIIEMKRTNEDCKQQLFNQASILKKNEPSLEVIPYDYPWPSIIKSVLLTNGYLEAIGQPNSMLADFADLVKSFNPKWTPIQPFASLRDDEESIPLYYQRIDMAIQSLSNQHEILNYRDRMGLNLDFGWAKEMVCYFNRNKEGLHELRLAIWPGNTKGQGTQMLNQLGKKPNWNPPSEIVINGNYFKVGWVYEIKFSHFSGYVTHILVPKSKVKEGKKLISWNNHWNQTGNQKREDWEKVEAFLEDYLKDDFDWRKEMGWDYHFANSKRTYFSLSIGYEIHLDIPFSYLQSIDKKVENLEALKSLLIDAKEKYKLLYHLPSSSNSLVNKD